MEFRYLRAFYLTGRHASFSKAARELRIAQSAVSRQIRLLEESLGFQLLLRAPGSVSLTAKGGELMAQLGVFSDWADRFAADDRQVVRIAAMEGVAANWLPEKLTKLKEPGVSIEMSVGSSSTVRRLIESGEVDLALLDQKVDTGLASSVTLFKESFELISDKGVDLDAVHEHRWIYVDKGSHLHRLTRKEPRDFVRTGSIGALIELVRRGFGIAVLPAHLLEGQRGFKRQPLEHLKEGTIHLATLNYAQLPRGVAAVHKALTT